MSEKKESQYEHYVHCVRCGTRLKAKDTNEYWQCKSNCKPKRRKEPPVLEVE